jgi:ABC-type dipeptide/oligopeptide/nickel transport system permease subunit
MLTADRSDEGELEESIEPSNQSASVRTRAILKSIRSNKGALIGAIIVGVFAIIAIVEYLGQLLGLHVTPYNPLAIDVGPPLAAPSFSHLMGTDQLGRDIFSRILTATPNDFAVSLTVIAFSLVVGAIIGSYSAFHGGLWDEALMRVTDIFFAIPALVLAMAIALALGPGIVNMTIALMVIWWPPYARLARGEALKIAHQNYIEAARLSGAGRTKIIFGHALPNISLTLLIYASLDVGTVVLVYAGLTFLGLGVIPPHPDWGEMVSSTKDYIISAPWLPFFPGLIIALAVIGFSLFGDGLKDTLMG